ncbi:unnamed protein product [Schistosoma mansoni]|uniref:Smp_205970 n=1 Tax=Schistosoma mansoni TaxID=6183 RepID=UPI00022C86AA|nr:unnamed protein product [Schistosoma mansoni]|eukprot:XP_018644795.1 unnamed protein product [Schistosoma mansoni]
MLDNREQRGSVHTPLQTFISSIPCYIPSYPFLSNYILKYLELPVVIDTKLFLSIYHSFQ